jgi:hypothetical protein
MSQVPEQPVYVRPIFDPNHPIDSKCPLCWDNGLLEGGMVLAEGEVFFVYAFVDEDGKPEGLLHCPEAAPPRHDNLAANLG